MENQFDYLAVEALEAKTVENIFAITGEIAINQELKALDAEWDLVTITNTGVELHYIHRSNKLEWQTGVVEFKVPLVVNNEEVAE